MDKQTQRHQNGRIAPFSTLLKISVITGLATVLLVSAPSPGYASTTNPTQDFSQPSKSTKLKLEIATLRAQLAQEKARAKNLRTQPIQIASQTNVDTTGGGINAMMASLKSEHAISNGDQAYIDALQGNKFDTAASSNSKNAPKSHFSKNSSDSNPLQAKIDALLDRNARKVEEQQFQTDLDYLDSLDQLREAGASIQE